MKSTGPYIGSHCLLLVSLFVVLKLEHVFGDDSPLFLKHSIRAHDVGEFDINRGADECGRTPDILNGYVRPGGFRQNDRRAIICQHRQGYFLVGPEPYIECTWRGTWKLSSECLYMPHLALDSQMLLASSAPARRSSNNCYLTNELIHVSLAVIFGLIIGTKQ